MLRVVMEELGAMNLSPEEYKMGKENKHALAVVNRKVSRMINLHIALRGIIHNRAHIKATRDMNKTLDSYVSVDPNEIANGKLPEVS